MRRQLSIFKCQCSILWPRNNSPSIFNCHSPLSTLNIFDRQKPMLIVFRLMISGSFFSTRKSIENKRQIFIQDAFQTTRFFCSWRVAQANNLSTCIVGDSPMGSAFHARQTLTWPRIWPCSNVDCQDKCKHLMVKIIFDQFEVSTFCLQLSTTGQYGDIKSLPLDNIDDDSSVIIMIIFVPTRLTRTWSTPCSMCSRWRTGWAGSWSRWPSSSTSPSPKSSQSGRLSLISIISKKHMRGNRALPGNDLSHIKITKFPKIGKQNESHYRCQLDRWADLWVCRPLFDYYGLCGRRFAAIRS